MRLKVIACKALTREVGVLSAGCENSLDISYLQPGDYDHPDRLRNQLQECLDKIDLEKKQYDAIALGYGLCDGGVCGVSSEQYPIVIPRAHNCAALLLDSSEQYRELFETDSSRFLFTPGWLEHQPGARAMLERYKGSTLGITLPQVTYPAFECDAEFCGNGGLLRDLLCGIWDNERFLVLAPGQACAASYHSDIFCRMPESVGE